HSRPSTSLNLHPSCFLPGPPPTRFYTLSLHDALPILSIFVRRFNVTLDDLAKLFDNPHWRGSAYGGNKWAGITMTVAELRAALEDRKSTRLNSSHVAISYAVFCLKKKKKRHNALCVRY